MWTREIACDESGSEGEKLLGGNTEVFAHAGVLLSVEEAAECVRETRRRIRSPATEYKANHLLRGKHRAVLVWLLGESGPIHGRARVFLVDKAFFAVRKLVDLLAGDLADARPGRDGQAAEMAVTLYREGPRVLGAERWTAFLEAFNDVMRGRAEPELFREPATGPAAGLEKVPGVAELLGGSGERLAGFLARPVTVPALDPLIPALVRAVVSWGGGTRPVSILHDQHNGLTEERIAYLKEVLGAEHGLAGLRLADSFHEPRVQVADFLAGVARKIAEEELNGRGDTELVTLLRPYVDPASIWGDERSWARLGGGS